MPFSRLLILSKYNFRVSNSLDPDQAPHFVGPDLGPNCLQGLSADKTIPSRQRVAESQHVFNSYLIPEFIDD